MIIMSSRKEASEIDELENDDERKAENVSISLYPQHIKKVDDYAEKHDMKKSEVIQELIEGLDEKDKEIREDLEYIKELLERPQSLKMKPSEEIAEELPEDISDEQRERIDRLFNDCETFFGFEIEGDEGLIIQVQKRDLKGAIWTGEMLDNFAVKLNVGYDGYVSKPNVNELIQRCAEAMDLSTAQHNRLIETFAKLRGLAVEDETSEESSNKHEDVIASLDKELAQLKQQKPLDKKRIRAIETTRDYYLKGLQEED